MKKLYLKIEKLWFKISQPIRFLLVGGFNTVASFIIYSSAILLNANYLIALIISYTLGIILSITTMRYYVFQSNKNIISEYTKASIVYLSCLLMNYIFLYILINIFQNSPILSQGIYTIISSIYLYLTHKKFSFK